MIDEPSKRRPGLDPEACTPVVMSDGQVWFLPRPYLTFTPIFRDGRPAGTWRWLSYGPPIDELIAAVGAAEKVPEFVLAVVCLGAFMLRRNYELEDEELAEVLVYRDGDPESVRIARELCNVATGGLLDYGGEGVLDDPKAPPAGSSSS